MRKVELVKAFLIAAVTVVSSVSAAGGRDLDWKLVGMQVITQGNGNNALVEQSGLKQVLFTLKAPTSNLDQYGGQARVDANGRIDIAVNDKSISEETGGISFPAVGSSTAQVVATLKDGTYELTINNKVRETILIDGNKAVLLISMKAIPKLSKCEVVRNDILGMVRGSSLTTVMKEVKGLDEVKYRIFAPDVPPTMDSQPNRLTIKVDEQNIVVDAFCG